MQIAFSTLSCPSWSVDQIVRAATEYGYSGVELRGIEAHVDLREVPELSAGNRSAFRARFADNGLTLCCLGSSARFADPATREKSREELKDYIELAADLGCPLVRVFGGNIPEGANREETARAIADELNALAPFARQHGVGIVVETHDSFSTGAEVSAVLAHVERDAIGVLWDMFHPFRHGESPSETHRLLRPYVKHVHVKDGYQETLTLLGEGKTPIAEMLRLLFTDKSAEPSLSPFVSVEWEKRWMPELAEPEIVLPQYAAVLRSYEKAMQ